MKAATLTILLGLFCSLVSSSPTPEAEDNTSSEVDIDEPKAEVKPYQYKYTVKDQDKQLFFEKTESGDENGKVTGKFSVLLADGKLLTIEYVASKEDGFVPKITLKPNTDPFSPEADDSVK